MRLNIPVIVFLSVICGFLFSSKRNADARAASTEQNTGMQIDKICNAFFLQTDYTNSVILKDIKVTDSTHQQLSLSGIVTKHGRTLIYRFTAADCFECVNIQLGLLKTMFPASVSNIKIIASYPGANDLNIVNRENDLRYPFFNTTDQPLDLAAERLHTPYFFMIDSALQVRNLFIPEKAIPDLTKRYLHHIEHLL